VFIKDQPQQDEQETLRSKDTQLAAVELPKCLEGPHKKGVKQKKFLEPNQKKNGPCRMAQMPGAGTGDSMVRFCRYR